LLQKKRVGSKIPGTSRGWFRRHIPLLFKERRKKNRKGKNVGMDHLKNREGEESTIFY